MAQPTIAQLDYKLGLQKRIGARQLTPNPVIKTQQIYYGLGRKTKKYWLGRNPCCATCE